jgi:pyruvate,water dikinase
MRILDNSNIVESYPGLCSPLTCSFAEEVYRLIFRRLTNRLIGEPLPAPISRAVDQMTTAYEGRMFYRLDNWYRLLQILPFSRRLIPIWQRSLGVGPDEAPGLDKGISPLHRLRVIGRFVSTWRRTPAMTRHLADEFTAARARLAEGFPSARFDGRQPAAPHAGSLAELGASYAQLRDDVLKNWDVTLVNDLRAFGYIAAAQRLGCPISGASIASLEPVRALAALRQMAQRTDDLDQLHTDSDLRHYLARDTPLASAMTDYIERYGDRGPEELKLETPTFRTHPGTLVNLLRSDSPTEDALTTATTSGRSTAAADARHDMTGLGKGLRGSLAGAVRRRALEAIAFREESRLNRSRIFGMVRGLVRAAGGILAETEVIAAPGDVFYLTMDEVFAPPADSRTLIAARRAEWEGYADHTPPDRIVVDDGSTPQLVDLAARAQEWQFPLRGTACSAGRVTGTVTVVTEPATAGDVRGRIIVARSTDPGGVFLLSQAAGVIAERGSLLSHTAIVARELDLPALVGVAGASTILRTGDEVCLDAEEGRVDLLISMSSTPRGSRDGV